LIGMHPNVDGGPPWPDNADRIERELPGKSMK
jgi:hypothetical protein